MRNKKLQIAKHLFPLILVLYLGKGYSQSINTNGCTVGGFGINANVYTNTTFTTGTIPPAGSIDWFVPVGGTGRNVIDQSNPNAIKTLLQNMAVINPSYLRRMNADVISYADVVIPGSKYKILIDAVWARDNFGGTGATDTTAYAISSKNAQDPAAWGPGATNVLGKNDLIDVAAHMFREVDVAASVNDLWFAGFINRAEPGGSAYMDFEFFAKKVVYDKIGYKFSSGGPDLGHTSFRFDVNGNISQIGDIMFNLSLTNGGIFPGLEMRVWVKYTDYLALKATPKNLPFRFGDFFDGALTGAAYGYANILPINTADVCGYVNSATQLPSAPEWGTRNTKDNIFTTSYSPYSSFEVGVNMSQFGLDNLLVQGADPCKFPWACFFVKTRSSASFSASLKDFAGPYEWGVPKVGGISANPVLSCTNTTVTIASNPARTDVQYNWTTINGNITSATNGSSITADKAGTYFVEITLPNGCKVKSDPFIVTADASLPPIRSGATATTVSCTGNNGSVNLTVTGGTAPFSYAWTGPSSYTASTQNLTGLAPGSYTAVITDSKGCTFTAQPAVVPAATPITVTDVITNVSCNAGKSGAIDITVTAGKSPFTYLWSTGNTTQDLVNVKAGSYSVTIKDADGCSQSFSFTVTEPAALTASIVKVDDTNPDPAVGNGTADLTVTGGTAPYSYAWTGPSGFTATTEDLTGLKYGSYTVTVTDAKGCTISKSVMIYEPEICNDGIDNDGDGLNNCQDTDCVPAKPSINGNAQPCIAVNETYTIASPVAGLTYNWVLPANATVVSGQGTSSLTIKWTSITPAQLCVRATNGSCESAVSCVNVSPNVAPSAPSTIIKN